MDTKTEIMADRTARFLRSAERQALQNTLLIRGEDGICQEVTLQHLLAAVSAMHQRLRALEQPALACEPDDAATTVPLRKEDVLIPRFERATRDTSGALWRWWCPLCDASQTATTGSFRLDESIHSLARHINHHERLGQLKGGD